MADKALEVARALLSEADICECGDIKQVHRDYQVGGDGGVCCRCHVFGPTPCQQFRPVRFEVRRGWQPMDSYPKDTAPWVLLDWPYWSSHAVIGRWEHSLGDWWSTVRLEGANEGPIGWMLLPATAEEDA